MSTLMARIAAAPISWGVSEVPGWGHQMAPKRVLEEIRSTGMRAAELGPDGYFATDEEVACQIRESDFSIVAGFVPLTFRFPGGLVDSRSDLGRTFARLRDTGARLALLAISSDQAGYDSRPRLHGDQWQQVVDALETVDEIAAENGLRPALHPHFGTYIESAEDAGEILRRSKVDLCLDTGHLALAGDDPATLASMAPGRIRHVHLKDVDAELADRVRRQQISYYDAVTRGLFLPLGQGDVRIDEVVTQLEASGYRGWYVLEQDVALTDEPPPNEGPLRSAMSSLKYLVDLEKRLADSESRTAKSRRDSKGKVT